MKVEKSKGDKLADIFCILLLISQMLYVLVSWGKFPDTIPAHYNAVGEIDRWGGKRGNSDRAGAVLPALSFSASGRTVSSDMEYRGYCDRGQQRKSLWCFAAPTQYHESRNRFYIYGSYHKNSIWNRAICVVFSYHDGNAVWQSVFLDLEACESKIRYTV